MTEEKANMGVIFDLDGVLIDTALSHLKAWQDLAAVEGFEMPEELFYSTFGMQNYQIIPQLVPDDTPREEIERMSEWKEDRYRQIVVDQLVPADGVIQLLDDLKRTAFRLAVGSSAPRANVQLMLDTAGLMGHFDALVSGEDVSNGKPHPETFTTAGGKLGLSPDRCVVVEDAAQGVEAGKAAGMAVVAVTSTRKREELSRADVIVDSLAEVNARDFMELIDSVAS